MRAERGSFSAHVGRAPHWRLPELPCQKEMLVNITVTEGAPSRLSLKTCHLPSKPELGWSQGGAEATKVNLRLCIACGTAVPSSVSGWCNDARTTDKQVRNRERPSRSQHFNPCFELLPTWPGCIWNRSSSLPYYWASIYRCQALGQRSSTWVPECHLIIKLMMTWGPFSTLTPARPPKTRSCSTPSPGL